MYGLNNTNDLKSKWLEARTLTSEQKSKKLFQTIARKYPELSEIIRSRDILQLVRLLRSFAHSTYIRSADHLYLEYYKRLYSPIHPYDQYLLLKANEIGFNCGGVAEYLESIYRIFGFYASAYSYGLEDKISKQGHVVTLVVLKQDDDLILSLQDGYFNCELIDKCSGDMDYLSLIEALKNSDCEKIEIFQYPAKSYDHYYRGDDAGKRLMEYMMRETDYWHSKKIITASITGKPVIKMLSNYSHHYKLHYDANNDDIKRHLSSKIGIQASECRSMQMHFFPRRIPYFGIRYIDKRFQDYLLRLQEWYTLNRISYPLSLV